MKSPIPALIINLDHRPDRLSSLTKSIQDFAADVINPVYRIPAVFEPTNGNRGCMMSHRAALQKAWDEGWEQFIIFEDDATLDYLSRERLLTCLAELPHDYKIFLASASWVEDRACRIHSQHLVEVVKFTGSHFVMYQREVIPQVLRAIRQNSPYLTTPARSPYCPMDHLLAVLIPTKYIACPFVGYVLDGDQSDIRLADPSCRRDLEECILPTEKDLLKLFRSSHRMTRMKRRRIMNEVYHQYYQESWQMMSGSLNKI